MSVQRTRRFVSICELVGAPWLKIIDAQGGWPGLAIATTHLGEVGVALHVSKVISHSRKVYEKRFENPVGEVVTAPKDFLPILIGLAQVGSRFILVAADGRSRVDRGKRFSILFNDETLMSAAEEGWKRYLSTSGEIIIAMHPRLLPIYIASVQSGAFPADSEMVSAAIASGVADANSEDAAERARRVGFALVRDSAFGGSVCKAYRSLCAMCGLGIGIVQGAHIFPASAPKSPDNVWNGIALCPNHHAAFDKHFIWIEPATRAIKLHNNILSIAASDAACKIFTENTRETLTIPAKTGDQPRPEMFRRRYEHFKGLYAWCGT